MVIVSILKPACLLAVAKPRSGDSASAVARATGFVSSAIAVAPAWRLGMCVFIDKKAAI